jgi:predicted dehydrogenase
MPSPLRVCLIGYGLAGKVFHAPLIANTPGLQLTSVVARDAARVQADFPDVRVDATTDIAFAAGDFDLVVIATPNATHAPLAEAALAHGKHVVIDKPFALSTAEAERVIAAARGAGRIVCAFHNRRWDADFLTLCELIDSGALGEIREFHSHFDRFRPVVPDRWRDRAEPGAGLWFDLGPHLVDQALQLFGMPRSIQADITRQREQAQSDDWFHVVLRYPSHRAILHAGSLVPDARLRFAVHGTGGSFLKQGLDPQEQALREGQHPGRADWGLDPNPGTLTSMHDGIASARLIPGQPGNYLRFYAQLHDAIRGNGPAPVANADVISVMRVIEAAVLSAERGERIDL